MAKWTVIDVADDAGTDAAGSGVSVHGTKRRRGVGNGRRRHRRDKVAGVGDKPCKRAITTQSAQCTTATIEDLDALPGWKPIKFPTGIAFTDGAAGGFTMLEEVDGVDVQYEDTPHSGRVVRFRAASVNNTQLDGGDDDTDAGIDGSDSDDEDAEAAQSMAAFESAIEATVDSGSKDSILSGATNAETTLSDKELLAMSAWSRFSLHPLLLRGMLQRGFTAPTAIQERVLDATAIDADQDHRDIVGAAETGSGKTLAFGLPILNGILHGSNQSGIQALILSPTRELAMQICDHLKAVSSCTALDIMPVVGGMSVQKQERLLTRCPDVIVATPGRLWELMSERQCSQHLSRMPVTLRYLVIDEADRMVEGGGHFRELDLIFNALRCTSTTAEPVRNEWTAQDMEMLGPELCMDNNDAESDSNGSVLSALDQELKATPRRQTFVFSATLTTAPEISAKVPRTSKAASASSTFDDLVRRIPFTNSERTTIDLTNEQLTARSLTESKIDCLKHEKDAYLYYFLLRYPGRTLVFVNSISCIRRLVPIFSQLNVAVFGLHAQMQQRQRLKNLDRFKLAANAVLVASDVAARGLDIPRVDHVIHYQLPRTAELYVHRSGRTARANRDGLTVMLSSPDEHKNYRMLCNVLKKEKGLPDFPVDLGLIAPLKQRISLAVSIDKLLHTNKKAGSDNKWMREMADKMDVMLSDDDDADNTNDISDEDDRRGRSQVPASLSVKVRNLRAELAQLLKRPLMPRGVSGRYLTGGTVANLPQRLIANSNAHVKGDVDLTAFERQSALNVARKPHKSKKK